MATCVAIGVFVALVIFMAQNTGRVQVSFLAMHGRFPLALVLLIATVAGMLIVAVLGTARISQLRRLVRRRGR